MIAEESFFDSRAGEWDRETDLFTDRVHVDSNHFFTFG